MDAREAIDWIHGRYGQGNKQGLTNTQALLQRLGNPHLAYPCVHVAGTNGKGSVCAMIASALRACGLRVGLYTSPYLQGYQERIRVDAEPIPDHDLGEIATQVRTHVEEMEREGLRATVFETGTACALTYFAGAHVDIAVVEAGLGGRLDATNVISPALSVIAHIGMDHERSLGNTVAEIAAHKAGIVKRRVPCVLYPQSFPQARDVVEAACAERSAPLLHAGDVRLLDVRSDWRGHAFDAQIGDMILPGIRLSLPGEHQMDNARTAIAALWALRAQGFDMPERDIVRGLTAAAWPGRLEWLGDRLLLDGAHNPQGARALADYVRQYLPGRKIVLLCGIQRHKAVEGIVQELAAVADEVFCVRVEGPHAGHPDDLAALFAQRSVQAQACDDVREGLAKARDAAGECGVALVCGSLYLVGEVRGMAAE